MSSNICGDTSIILDDNSCIMKESSERWNRNKVISIAIVVLVVAVFVISLVVYSIEQSWTAAGTICMAGIAGIGIVYSSITVSLMKEETRPYVFVDFIIDKNAPSMIDIELINCGKSSAIDVDIKVIAPEIEEEMLNKKIILQRISDMSIIKNTIQYLLPGRSHVVMYCLGHMIHPYLPLQYTFEINYKDSYGKKYCDRITIEPMYLMDCSSADSRTNQLLKSIGSELSSIKQILARK